MHPDWKQILKNIEDRCDSGLNNSADGHNILGYCTFERDCNPLASLSFAEHEGLLPVKKQVKPFVATPYFVNLIHAPEKAWETANQILPETLYSYPTPPIYLVNSAFLN